jgi:hypothetical protein
MPPRPSLLATLLRARNGCGAFLFSRPGRSAHVRRRRGHRLLRDLHPVAAVKQDDRVLDCLLVFCDLVSPVGLPATQGLSGSFGAFCSRHDGQTPFCALAGHGHELVPNQPAAGTRTALLVVCGTRRSLCLIWHRGKHSAATGVSRPSREDSSGLARRTRGRLLLDDPGFWRGMTGEERFEVSP